MQLSVSSPRKRIETHLIRFNVDDKPSVKPGKGNLFSGFHCHSNGSFALTMFFNCGSPHSVKMSIVKTF